MNATEPSETKREYETCPDCGAVQHGNLFCLTCLKHTRDQMRADGHKTEFHDWRIAQLEGERSC